MVRASAIENGLVLLIATWNLNHRVGYTAYRPEAARSIATLGADVLVLTEYFPQEEDARFRSDLRAAGYSWLSASDNRGLRANTVLIASRLPAFAEPLALPGFDEHFDCNLHAIRLHEPGMVVIGVRVPWYTDGPTKIGLAWDWLESLAAQRVSSTTVIAGDFNTAARPTVTRGGKVLMRMLESGWKRAAPPIGGSFIGKRGQRSEIDHILVSPSCEIGAARYVVDDGGIQFAGEHGLSDHAILVADIRVAQAA